VRKRELFVKIIQISKFFCKKYNFCFSKMNMVVGGGGHIKIDSKIFKKKNLLFFNALNHGTKLSLLGLKLFKILN